ncbi:hypothetical protein JTE88_03625 [Arcanobacterium phocisimile]|uniref:ABC-2 family transporter protein n=1 Tax=Arcanobacterium phocisimile TaxID=1302235 RepID=A0ABX7IL38_9ACTO|nr:hypothetical protein [Arcanobacterium phocisimile]QRV02825.1 hypothetical protein JTE88_03625 [Arcanobacterium phocisimile]
MKPIKSEFIRFWSMTEAYLAMLPVAILSLVFSVINIGVINAVLVGDLESQQLDPSLASKPLATLLSEGYLGPVYQSAVIFIPLAVAYLANLEYIHGDHEEAILIPGSLMARRIGTIACMGLWSILTTLCAAIINFAVCLILLDPAGQSQVSVVDAFAVCLRVFVFSLLFTTLALAISAITQRLFTSIIILIGLFMVSLAGVFMRLLPPLHNALPLIGGKSFAFYDPAQGPFSVVASFWLLIAWMIIPALVYLFVAGLRRR